MRYMRLCQSMLRSNVRHDYSVAYNVSIVFWNKTRFSSSDSFPLFLFDVDPGIQLLR
jgi:hypothetical protein